MIRLDPPEKIPSPGDQHLPDNMVNRLQVGERWVNPLPDEASRAKWEPEKKTRFAGLFFLTGLRPVLPLGQWLQAGMASLQSNSTFSSYPKCLQA